MRLEELFPGVVVRGLVPDGPVTVVANRAAGKQAAVITYRSPDGGVDEVVVYRSQEPELQAEEESRPWSLTADPALFRLAAEARRIHLAYLFDTRMAIHLSKVDPLPHQISAVYGEMLPRLIDR